MKKKKFLQFRTKLASSVFWVGSILVILGIYIRYAGSFLGRTIPHLPVQFIWGIIGVCILTIVFWIYTRLTDPFSRGNIFHFPYRTSFENGKFIFCKEGDIRATCSRFASILGVVKCGFHILAYNFYPEKFSDCASIDAIRKSIYRERFNPDRCPFLVTGGHFVVMYPRNFAIFFREFLNPDAIPSEHDGQDRFRLYVQTASFARDMFYACGDNFTTVVPIGRRTVACVNFYNYPSDGLYGIFYAFHQLHAYVVQHPQLDFSSYQNNFEEKKYQLQFLLEKYIATVYDDESGLIKKSAKVSSARDGIVRQSAFYDNVIFWKTLVFATELGLSHSIDTNKLKDTILTTFWSEEDAFFRDDLSQSAEKPQFSSDWLIAIMSDFLTFDNPQEVTMIQRIIDTMIAMKIDEPIPLRYSLPKETQDDIGIVRFAAKDYMGKGIWSLWGMEYLRTLYLLGNTTKNEAYTKRADHFLKLYEEKIKEYCGFPEVYDTHGNLMNTFLYRSVIRTGWIVSYDGVVALRGKLGIKR